MARCRARRVISTRRATSSASVDVDAHEKRRYRPRCEQGTATKTSAAPTTYTNPTQRKTTNYISIPSYVHTQAHRTHCPLLESYLCGDEGKKGWKGGGKWSTRTLMEGMPTPCLRDRQEGAMLRGRVHKEQAPRQRSHPPRRSRQTTIDDEVIMTPRPTTRIQRKQRKNVFQRHIVHTHITRTSATASACLTSITILRLWSRSQCAAWVGQNPGVIAGKNR